MAVTPHPCLGEKQCKEYELVNNRNALNGLWRLTESRLAAGYPHSACAARAESGRACRAVVISSQGRRSARCHHKAAGHKRNGRKEESHFRWCQCPIVTHVAPQLLDLFCHPAFLPKR